MHSVAHMHTTKKKTWTEKKQTASNSNSKWHSSKHHQIHSMHSVPSLTLFGTCMRVSLRRWNGVHVRESHNDIAHSPVLALFYLEYLSFRFTLTHSLTLRICITLIVSLSLSVAHWYFFVFARKTCENHKHEYREHYLHRYMTCKREHRTRFRVLYDMFRHWWQNWRIIDMNKENIDVNAYSFIRTYAN